MADPKYVRLADHLTRGMRADLNSGFSIAGYDVVEMPDKEEEPEQYKFVRSEIASGRLEAASKAEYEEVHPDLYESLGVEVERATVVQAAPLVQETHIQAAAAKGARKVRAAREEVSEDALEADEERRKAAISAQKAQASGSPKSRRRAAQEAAEADAALLEASAEGEGEPAVEDDDATSRQRHQ